MLPVKEESYADLLGLKAKEEDVFKSFRERDDSAIPGDIDFEPSTESVMSYMMNAYLTTRSTTRCSIPQRANKALAATR